MYMIYDTYKDVQMTKNIFWTFVTHIHNRISF